jgi:hypothetical protein
MKTLGTQRVRAPAVSMMNTGELGFHAGVAAGLPGGAQAAEGKLDASGSLWMSCEAVNVSIGCRSSSNERKASCFSAVRPVWGWNQWVKCVTPVRHRPFLDRLRHHRRDLHVELLPEADAGHELA